MQDPMQKKRLNEDVYVKWIFRPPGWINDLGRPVEPPAWDKISDELAALKKEGWLLVAIVEPVGEHNWAWLLLKDVVLRSG